MQFHLSKNQNCLSFWCCIFVFATCQLHFAFATKCFLLRASCIIKYDFIHPFYKKTNKQRTQLFFLGNVHLKILERRNVLSNFLEGPSPFKNKMCELQQRWYTTTIIQPGGGGNSHVKAHRDVLPKWVTFSPKILRHGFHFGQKKSLEEGPISQNMQKKNGKISHFWGRKPLRNGSWFVKISKKTIYSAIFWVRKILRYG